MLPQSALIIPLYVVLARYHQVNQLTGLIITYLTFVLPFSIWMLRGFIIGIPKDLEEAAMVDGNSRTGAFVRILLPLVAPGLVATSIFAFIQAWNEFIFAYILLSDQQKQTLTVWLAGFLGHEPRDRLGRADGRGDADCDPGRDLLPDRAAPDRVRADRRGGARMSGSSGSRRPASSRASRASRRRTGCCAGSRAGSAGSASSATTCATASSWPR